MDGIAPTLKLLLDLRYGLECGESAHVVIKNSLDQADPEIVSDVRKLILAFESQSGYQKLLTQIRSPHRRALFQLILSSFAGNPIQVKLQDLEREILWQCEEDMEKFIVNLPLKVMIPILILQFPAFLFLFLGPLLAHILKELSV